MLIELSGSTTRAGSHLIFKLELFDMSQYMSLVSTETSCDGIRLRAPDRKTATRETQRHAAKV